MFLTYRYQLRPSRAQYGALARVLESQRQLYNAALLERIGAWRAARMSINYATQSKSLTAIRADDPAVYGALPACLSRWTLKKVDDAFAAFFRRVKARAGRAGFPRYRGRDGWRSFGFTEFSGIRLQGDRLVIKGVAGALRLRLHRPLPAGAVIKACTFTREGRKWFVGLQLELQLEAPAHPHPDAIAGLDWGLEHLATLSTGEHLPNPRLGADAAAELRRAARKLARAKRGSHGRLKARERLARLQRRLARRRRAHLHKVSADLVRRFGGIAVEQLSVDNMTRSAAGTAAEPGRNVRAKSGLNREILDTSPSTLMAMLAYKAERAGSRFVAVDPRNTSQACSVCGALVPKALRVRVHKCECGAELQRDINAATNILQRAVAGAWGANGPIAARCPEKAAAA